MEFTPLDIEYENEAIRQTERVELHRRIGNYIILVCVGMVAGLVLASIFAHLVGCT